MCRNVLLPPRDLDFNSPPIACDLDLASPNGTCELIATLITDFVLSV